MPKSTRIRRQFAATAALASASLALASAAGAVDLRDWGKKYAASERFVVLAQFNNQAVLDKETQLVWQRTPGVDFVTFDFARDVCDRATIGGRMGWRLPSLPELRSLVDPAVTGQNVASMPAGHPFVGVMPPYGNGAGGINYGRYWTSSLNSSLDTTKRHNATMTLLYSYAIGIGVANAATWCVRGAVSPSD